MMRKNRERNMGLTERKKACSSKVRVTVAGRSLRWGELWRPYTPSPFQFFLCLVFLLLVSSWV